MGCKGSESIEARQKSDRTSSSVVAREAFWAAMANFREFSSSPIRLRLSTAFSFRHRPMRRRALEAIAKLLSRGKLILVYAKPDLGSPNGLHKKGSQSERAEPGRAEGRCFGLTGGQAAGVLQRGCRGLCPLEAGPGCRFFEIRVRADSVIHRRKMN